MKKSDRKLLAETLDKALEPPRAKRKPALASLLTDYDRETEPPPATEGIATPPPQEAVPPDQSPSPQRDFNKRANTLDRLALPAGIFPGSSKKLYDALYVRTRGAVVPVKSIRATKRELSEWSGIRNAKTIDAHLRYFSAVGLIVSTWEKGQNDGALYEVLLPEETSGLFMGSRGVTPRHVGSPQNLGSPHPTYLPLKSTVYEDRKTLIQKNDDDDEEKEEKYLSLALLLSDAEKELTGKNSSKSEQWEELAELLVTELRMAAGRTTVSNVPAFLTEHLRRRLWKKEKRQLDAESAEAGAASTQGAAADASQCPDCFGTGMFYPEGFEKGVARCRHPKLEAPPVAQRGP